MHPHIKFQKKNQSAAELSDLTISNMGAIRLQDFTETGHTPCPEKRCHFIFACDSAKC